MFFSYTLSHYLFLLGSNTNVDFHWIVSKFVKQDGILQKLQVQPSWCEKTIKIPRYKSASNANPIIKKEDVVADQQCESSELTKISSSTLSSITKSNEELDLSDLTDLSEDGIDWFDSFDLWLFLFPFLSLKLSIHCLLLF